MGHTTHTNTETRTGWAGRIADQPELARAISSGVLLAVGVLLAQVPTVPSAIPLVLYAGALLSGGYDAARHGIGAALHLHFDIDLLMVVAAAGAVTLGAVAEGALLLFLFSLGHALEHMAMDHARKAISDLGELTPSTARVVDEGQEREVSVEDLSIGTTVVVRAGERLPADGEIVRGSGAVDQAPVTGESVPVDKEPGDTVFAGTVNGNSTLHVSVTRRAEDSTLARVIQMVSEAESQRAPSQRFTERFTRVFVPIVLVAVVALIAIPPLVGLLPFRDAFLRAMTVLVATSPCALAIATPAAVLSGIARAARAGILMKGGVHLENLGSLGVVAFDKTGTITAGQFTVTDVLPGGGESREALLQVAAAVEAGSSHPLAEAVIAEVRRAGLALTPAEDVRTVGGSGISGSVDGRAVRVGNRRMVTPPEDSPVDHLQADGKTCMLVERDGEYLGVIALRDEARTDAAPAIARLKRLGISRTVLVTGDTRATAEAIAAGVGIDECRPEQLPEDKVAAVEDLAERHGAVAMVGDGVNDAPALARATVGIAMGAGGTDVALESADVALMADELGKLGFAVELSRRARRTIVQNLVISLGVMGLLLVAAITGVASIGPAIVVHEGSTLVVVANGLRLLGMKETRS